MSRKRGLGRGLDALLGIDDAAESADIASPDSAGNDLGDLDIDAIHPGQYQPRRTMRDDGLQELAASIRAQGVMQPIVVRHRPAGGYEIIAGERRWRAARLAGLGRIPALIKDVSDERAIAMALIENIQREDLNPLEEALALQRLQEEFHLTQQQVADAVGKSRVAVTNLLRLINLAAPVKSLLAEGKLEMGHARALLPLPPQDQEAAAGSVIARGLSVRQTEAMVRKRLEPARFVPIVAPQVKDPDTARLERELADRIGAPVTITFDGKSAGTLVIQYNTMDELEGILKHLR